MPARAQGDASASTPSKRTGAAGFLSRALTNKSSSTSTARDPPEGRAHSTAERRLSGIAPLPPSLAGDATPAAPALPTSLSPPASRPPTTRSTSSYSVSSSHSYSSPTTDRRPSASTQAGLLTPSTSSSSLRDRDLPSSPRSTRSTRSAASSTTSTSTSTSTTSIRHGRPISTVFPSRPASIYSSSASASASASSSRSTPGTPTRSAGRNDNGRRTSRISWAGTDEERDDADSGLLVFAPAPSGTGTGQMDALVSGMRRNGNGKGKARALDAAEVGDDADELGSSSAGEADNEWERERRLRERARRRRSRRESSLSGFGGGEGGLDDWAALSSALAAREAETRAFDPRRLRESSTRSVSASSGGGGGGGGSRSRETSALSDVSFASIGAGPSAAQLAAAAGGGLQPVDEDDLYVPGLGFGDVTGAPSMERQETLKALERPWMAGFAAAGAAGQPKSVEELVGQYKEQLRERTAAGRMMDDRRMSVLSVSPSPPALVQVEEDGAKPPLEPLPEVREPPVEVDDPPPPPPRERRRSSTRSPSPPLAYVPFPQPATSSPASLSPPAPHHPPTRIKSIDEIVAEHAAATYAAARRPSASAPPASAGAPPPLASNGAASSPRAREESQQSLASQSSGMDSLDEEIRLAGATQQQLGSVAEVQVNGLAPSEAEEARTPRLGSLPSPPPLQRSPSLRSSVNGIVPAVDALLHDDDARSASSRPATPSTPRVQSPKPLDNDTLSTERDLALLLKSPRLTRLFTLRQAPNAGLTVSFADVGSPTGHPVLVFLGLGSVRFLVALYDEIASVLGLRLICVDRWGLGRTSDVPDSQRGFVEWASVVAELVSPACLDLPSFSLLAHSAGAPYAVASAVHGGIAPLVRGSVHLLAPWVSTSADSLAGMYKYLKYVPSGVLKTAQAAEWKMQAWRLGKPPQLVHAAVGYDAKAGRLTVGEDEREKWTPAAAGDAAANGGAAKVAELYGADAGVVVAGPAQATPPKSKGWKASGAKLFLRGLSGGGDKSSNGAGGAGGDDGGGVGASPSSLRSSSSSLRPPSMLGKRASLHGGGGARSTPPPEAVSPAASSRVLTPSGLPLPARRSSLLFTSGQPPSPSTPTRSDSLSSLPSSLSTPRSPSPYGGALSPASPTSPSLSNSLTPSPSTSSIAPAALIDGLLRASHAESLRGGTSDLLVLLERTSTSASSSSTPGGAGGKKGLGFDYRDLAAPVKVWYGDRDDRISESSIRWLERELKAGRSGRCDVRIVEGADHSLMANGRVMLDVLESIADEWDRLPTLSPRPSLSSPP
ncbi:hypothetical protein JCM10207_004686 [Rhodosporidiobolus poonsookiae]